MNKKILAPVTLVALVALVTLSLAAVLLSGCKEGGDRAESELPPESAVSSTAQNSDNSSDSSAPPTESAVSSEAQSNVESTTSSDTSGEKQTGMPEEISKYIDGLDNGGLVFVDYTFTEAPAAITDKSALGEDYEKALTALKATDDYKRFSGSFSKNAPQAMFSRPAGDFFSAVGSPEPIFKGAFRDDLDRDGTEESFILISMAKLTEENGDRWGERDYLVFVGNGGAEVICDYYKAKFGATLDYGSCKQVIVDSDGWSGNDKLSNIWGVRSGKASRLYGGRLSYEKTDCFLYSSGPQYIGDFAVYDISRGEYLAIQGKELTAADISAMDSSVGDVSRAVMIGGKYFIINGGCRTYENGKFAASDKKVRSSDTPGITGEALKTLADIDYDKALASMISPEEARKLN